MSNTTLFTREVLFRKMSCPRWDLNPQHLIISVAGLPRQLSKRGDCLQMTMREGITLTQQTLVATRGSFPRPATSAFSNESLQDSLRAASGSWSHTLPRVHAAVSCTCTARSFIREMRISIFCSSVYVCLYASYVSLNRYTGVHVDIYIQHKFVVQIRVYTPFESLFTCFGHHKLHEL